MNGERSFADGATSPVHDPSDGSVLAHIPMATVDDVDAAVAASRASLHDPAWRAMDPSERGRVLRRIAEVTYSQAKTLAPSNRRTMGRPSAKRSPRSRYGASTFEYFAGLTDKIEGSTIRSPATAWTTPSVSRWV